MSYTLDATERPGFLHVRVTGENTPQVAAAYLREILVVCAGHHCGVVLIEENLSGPPLDVMEIFRLASEAAENSRAILRQVAYVDTNPDHSLGLMRFAGDVAIERGMNVRVFTTVREAEQWLADSVARPE